MRLCRMICTMWIPRLIEPVLKQRMQTRPVVVLTGARQTGKTALVRRLFPQHAYVSLDLPSEAEQAEREPIRFLERHPPPLVVDEVQYAPKLLRHVKRAVDARRTVPGQFLLTGSQPFELMAGVTESLAGRAGVLQLATLSYAEVVQALPQTSLEEMLVRGGFPELYEKPDLDALGSTSPMWQPILNAICGRSCKWAVWGISSGSCEQRPSARRDCSIGPNWRTTWESAPRRPANGSRPWSARGSLRCWSRGSPTAQSRW